MKKPKLRWKLKPMDWNNSAEVNAYRHGVIAAASFAGEYNGVTHHPCHLEDCILAKFNLIEGTKLRRNKSGC